MTITSGNVQLHNTLFIFDKLHCILTFSRSSSLTCCMLNNFACLIIFKYFCNTTRVLISLDQDQARRFVGPDLGPNSLQRLSTDGT